MGIEASPLTVKNALMKEHGLLPDKAEELITKHSSIVETGQKLRSFAYYVAGQVVDAEIEALGGLSNLPESYLDPNWTEPVDEEDDDDQEDQD